VTGPAGEALGISTSTTTAVPLTTAMAGVTVMTSRTVPVAGDYYVSASILTRVDAGDTVACYINNQHGNHVPAFGPAANETYAPLPLDDVITLNAGASISVVCVGYTGKPNTEFFSGTINALLVGNSNPGPAGPLRGGSRPALPGRL
jgi:hypothetical protein